MIIFAEKDNGSMYIHQNPDWPHFKWDNDAVSSALIKVNRSAGFLAGRLSSIGFNGQMSAVVESLTSDIVYSSEIEGVQLNSDQVRSSVARKLGVQIPVFTDTSHYIDGIVDMMLDATKNFTSPLSSERLFGWHNCLFPNGRSGYLTIDVGKYRSEGMKVVSGTMGREKIHYEAPSPDSIPSEMEKFLEWFNSQGKATYLKSAIAHFWFVTIHSFDDGNGRIGRAIADMVLSQADESDLRFFSMSRQINADKRAYYDILEKTQKGGMDITPWLVWYLECMDRAIGNADADLSQVLLKAVFWQTHAQTVISDRQKLVLNVYLDGRKAKLTAKNWAKLSKVSTDTAARDISDLVGKSILIPQQGRVRDVNYGLAVDNDHVLVPGPPEDALD